MDDKERKGISRRGALKTIAGGLVGASVIGLGRGTSQAQQAKAGVSKATRKPKIVLMGLDSCQMTKIIEWANQGKLPTFKRILSQGSYGEFENIFRGYVRGCVGCLQHRCRVRDRTTSSGPTPGQLYDKMAYQTSGINRLFDFTRPRFPFMLAEGGVKVGLCGTAMSCPPRALEGRIHDVGQGGARSGRRSGLQGPRLFYAGRDTGLPRPLKTRITFEDGKVSTVIKCQGREDPSGAHSQSRRTQ